MIQLAPWSALTAHVETQMLLQALADQARASERSISARAAE
jgi:hypothetical protein